MAEKTENGKPTKDAIVKFIIEEDYNVVSSRMLSLEYHPSKKQGRLVQIDRGLTHYIGIVLSELANEGMLEIVNKSAPSMKYKVNRNKLLEFYNSIPQSSLQPSS